MSTILRHPAVDIQAIKDSTDIVDFIRNYIPGLERRGNEYLGLCPFHDDSKPSFAVVPHKQIWSCRVCDLAGDIFDFVQQYESCDFPTALATITGKRPADAPPPEKKAKPPTITRNVVPPPESNLPPVKEHNGLWWYHTASGRPWFCIARHDGAAKSNGKTEKRFCPWTYTAEDGWKAEGIESPKPLYNLHLLAQAPPGVKVILVEGEKCADAASRLFPSQYYVAMTWLGGAAGVRHADFSPLEGRDVWIWPDPDPAGAKATETLIDRLHGIANRVLVWNVSDCDATFDVAEAEKQGWTYDRIKAWHKDILNGQTRGQFHRYPDEVTRAALTPAPEPTKPDPKAPPPVAHTAAVAQHWRSTEWGKHLIMGGEKHDTPLKVIANACVVFRHAPEWRDLLCYDELFQVIRCARPTPWGEHPEQWTDHHDTAATEWLDHSRLHFATGMVAEAIVRVARQNHYHPVQQYLGNLTWDGVSRCGNANAPSWLTTYLKAPDTLFTRFVGAAWLISACARAMQPGSRVKTALVLYGPQDTGKSTALEILGGKWYGTQIGIIGGDSTKAREQANKLWIIENAELAATKKSDVDAVKDFISTNTDNYRPAYSHHVQSLPRSCVFAFTTNNDFFLTDETGNVRFWPVLVPEAVDLESLRRDRDQLWAEAFHRFKAGEAYWITDAQLRDEAVKVQRERVAQDEWTVAIQTWLAATPQMARWCFTLGEVMDKALLIEPGRQTMADQRRAAGILRSLGMYGRKRDNVRVWVREGHESPASAQSDRGDGVIASEYDN